MPLPRGIRPIPVPTNLPIGLTNAYVLEGDPLTLVDTGPKTDEAYEALRKGLKDLGHGLADLRQILLTHGHVDHAGLAEAVRADSGARLLVPEGDRPMVERFADTFKERRARFSRELLRAGAPEETAGLVDGFFEWIRQFGESAKVAGVLREGDVVRAGGYDLRALHTPGHTAGSTCYLEADGVLFAGDTMIRDLTPNAAFGAADGVSVGLGDHVASLGRLRGLPVTEVLPGHRESFRDVKAYAADYRARFDARQTDILRLLRLGPSTPFDLMVEIFGTLPIQEVFLGVTEVLGHLEVLVARGSVVAGEKDGRTVFTLSSP